MRAGLPGARPAPPAGGGRRVVPRDQPLRADGPRAPLPRRGKLRQAGHAGAPAGREPGAGGRARSGADRRAAGPGLHDHRGPRGRQPRGDRDRADALGDPRHGAAGAAHRSLRPARRSNRQQGGREPGEHRRAARVLRRPRAAGARRDPLGPDRDRRAGRTDAAGRTQRWSAAQAVCAAWRRPKRSSLRHDTSQIERNRS